MGDRVIQDGWSDSIDPICNYGMGMTAENLVVKYAISREEMDKFALESHQKAATAWESGAFDEEITPIEVPAYRSFPAFFFSKDESIRKDTSLEKMAQLRPAFKEGGSVTAGNSCGMTDGASAIIIASRKKANTMGIKPLFSIISAASLAVENSVMGEGPALSMSKALEKTDMVLNDMDLIEVNEAFAAQVLSNERVLKWDRSRVNIHGGAIALGHPTGCSGVRIITTLYHALKKIDGENGVAGICGAGGVSCAVVIRRE
jgi:acetyl-CoA C-acetyltransferase